MEGLEESSYHYHTFMIVTFGTVLVQLVPLLYRPTGPYGTLWVPAGTRVPDPSCRDRDLLGPGARPRPGPIQSCDDNPVSTIRIPHRIVENMSSLDCRKHVLAGLSSSLESRPRWITNTSDGSQIENIPANTYHRGPPIET